MLGVGSELTLIASDVPKFISHHQQTYDIILIDPPFTKKMANEVMQVVGESALFHDDTEVFIESTSQETVKDEYSSMVLKKRQSYGDKFLSHYNFG